MLAQLASLLILLAAPPQEPPDTLFAAAAAGVPCRVIQVNLADPRVHVSVQTAHGQLPVARNRSPPWSAVPSHCPAIERRLLSKETSNRSAIS